MPVKRSTLRLMRSRRLSSGLRRRPAVMTTALLEAISSMPPALMRWSATRLAPWSRSVAWPSARSLLASMRQMLLTTPPHCRANAVELPTSPPPPMMLTFMEDPRRVSHRACERRHHLIGDRPDELLHVRCCRDIPVTAHLAVAHLALASGLLRLLIATTERIVRAQVAVLATVETDIVVTQTFLEIEQLL